MAVPPGSTSEVMEVELSVPPSLMPQGLRGAARSYFSRETSEEGDWPSSSWANGGGGVDGGAGEGRGAGGKGDDTVSGEDDAPLLPSTKTLSARASQGHGHHGFGGASRSSAVFNLSTTIVGAGIMALPATMKVLGLPLGLIVIGFMGLLSEISIEMMLKTSTPRQCWSYGELVAGLCGFRAKFLLQISILVNNVGICIAYLIIIADVLSGTVGGGGPRHTGLLEEWAGGSSFWTSRFLVLCATCLFVLGPLVAQKHVDSLKFTSAVSIALAVLFVAITAVVFLIKLIDGKINAPRLLPTITSRASILQLCSIIPVMSNAFICHFNVHPIWVELKDRSEGAMRRVSRLSLLLCTSVYLATAVSGYLLFGENIASDILANFDENLGIPGSDILDDIVRIGYAVHVMLVFPLVHFALRQSMDDLLFVSAKPLVDDNPRFVILTVVQMGVIFIGAVLVPNIWIAFQFTGATSAVSIGFIFPALLALRDKSGMISGGEKRLALFMLILAVVVGMTGVLSNVFNMVDADG